MAGPKQLLDYLGVHGLVDGLLRLFFGTPSRESSGSFLRHARRRRVEMAVDIEGKRRLRMTEPVLNGLDRYAAMERLTRMTMTQVMESRLKPERAAE